MKGDPRPADYEPLVAVLQEAHARAAHGKGKERHAADQPFLQQWIIQGGLEYGTEALLFQVRKKMAEHFRLGPEAGDRELLDCIVYLAAAVIVRRQLREAAL